MCSSLHCYSSFWQLGAGLLFLRTRCQILFSLLEAIRAIFFWWVLWNFDFEAILEPLLFLIIQFSLFLNGRSHNIWRRRSRILTLLTFLAWRRFVLSKWKITFRNMHIFHFLSVLILRNSKTIIFVIQQILIIIFEIKLVYFWWVLIQILCLVHLRFSSWWNIWLWTGDSSWAHGSLPLLWMSRNSTSRSRYTGRDSRCRPMIWNIHLVSMLVQFIRLNFILLFRIFRSLMKWPTQITLPQ